MFKSLLPKCFSYVSPVDGYFLRKAETQRGIYAVWRTAWQDSRFLHWLLSINRPARLMAHLE